MATFETQRGALHYEMLGEGRPVVLIHGFTNFGLSWAPQLPALVHAGYRVILPDLHGHGSSQPATALCTVADLAAQLTSLLDRLDAKPAVLCGLSLGGMVALEMAIARPDRVAGLIVANSRSSFTGPEVRAMVDGWIALFQAPHGPVRRLQATWPMLANAAFRDSSAGRAAYEAWSRVLARLPGSSLCHVAEGMTWFDLRARLKTIRMPALFVSGERDRLFGAEEARAMADEVAGAVCSVIPDAGHLSSLDSADRFNRLLLDFLAAHFPPATPT